jgi:type VI secretion system secreted protein Hcp
MKKLHYSLFILPLLFFATEALSQGRMYMKVSAPGFTFNGGVTDAGYLKQISVDSYSDGLQGCATTSTGMAPTACKTSLSPFQAIIPLSLAVIDFRSAMLQGKLLTTVDFVATKSSGGISMAYYKIHMENVLISSVQEGGSGGGEIGTISLALTPAKIAWQVITQSATGAPGTTSSYGWDFSKNAPFNYKF